MVFEPTEFQVDCRYDVAQTHFRLIIASLLIKFTLVVRVEKSSA